MDFVLKKQCMVLPSQIICESDWAAAFSVLEQAGLDTRAYLTKMGVWYNSVEAVKKGLTSVPTNAVNELQDFCPLVGALASHAICITYALKGQGKDAASTAVGAFMGGASVPIAWAIF